jgi:pyruvate ferredoxin oxidoreductase gamma subunit
MALCRIDNRPIRLREPVTNPDALIIQDPTLLHQITVFEGLRADGFVLINSARSLHELGLASFFQNYPPNHVFTVPATELALRYVGRPLPNSTLLGGFAAMTGALKLSSVVAAIRQKFPGKVGTTNSQAAEAAFEIIAGKIGRSLSEDSASDIREEIHVEAD